MDQLVAYEDLEGSGSGCHLRLSVLSVENVATRLTVVNGSCTIFKMQDALGYIREIKPRYLAAGQRKAMATHNIARAIQEGGKPADGVRLGTIKDVLKMGARGRVIAVQHMFLLANPRSSKRLGGKRKDFWRTFDALEAKGCILWELHTGYRSDNPKERDLMTREAIEALARGRHKTSDADKRGRPPQKFTEEQLRQAYDAWHSRKLKTWAEVAKKMPAGFTLTRAYKTWGRRNLDE
jgi:hypothetical protein